MRFSAAIAPKQPLRNAAARHFMRRIAGAKPAPQPKPAPVREPVPEDDLPLALDERVRLLGEW